jgi:DNA repair protein RadD
MKLRDYQDRGVASVRKHWRAGVRNVLCVAPTGAGKTVMEAELLRGCTVRKRGLFLVHRREIVNQAAEAIAKALGEPVGIIMAGCELRPGRAVQVASIQTVIARGLRDTFDTVVVDEAHHIMATEWRKVLDVTSAKRIAGFTATPERQDGKGLGDVFDQLVDVVPHSELLARKLLVPCRVLCPPEWDPDTLAMDPVEAYCKYTPGTCALFFVESLDAVYDVRDRLNLAGVRAEAITGITPSADRDARIEALRAGRLDALVNYGTLTEGVDIPRVQTIVLSRPAAHEGTFLQITGRGLRSFRGKRHATLIDLTGAVFAHGMPHADREYSLKGTPIKLGGGLDVLRALRVARGTRGLACVELVEASDAWLARNGGPRVVDWAAVDWARTDVAIARDLGCNGDTVRVERKRRGIAPTVTCVHVAPKTWHAVDWTRSDSAIARDLGCTAPTVGRERKRRGIAPTVTRVHVAPKTWGAVDWTRSDRAIARDLGCNGSTVRVERKRRGIEPTRLFMHVTPEAWGAVDWTRSDRAIARDLGCSGDTVRVERKRRGIAPRPTWQRD